MVAFKNLLLIAAAVVGVVAQDDAPEGDATAAQAYWDSVSAGAETQTGDAAEKRSLVHAARTAVVMKDPYAGSTCSLPFSAPPADTHCTRNNCYRGFLNARSGSSGKHCPKEAFGVCCAWNFAGDFFKWWAVQTNVIYTLAPYATSCKGTDDGTWDVVNKINDVCGCTIGHSVTIDSTSDYYGLRAVNAGNAKCHS